jgi:hypothetical protein
LEHSKAMNQPQKKRSNDLERSNFRQRTRLKFRLCATLKTCDLHIMGNA